MLNRSGALSEVEASRDLISGGDVIRSISRSSCKDATLFFLFDVSLFNTALVTNAEQQSVVQGVFWLK